MFDVLCKPKFYTKCKSLVKITKTRVKTVKKKNSVCRYLKNDIVDLLNNSLDYNAYGRAEGLILEKRRLSCYESLEQFCICVASNVSLLQKSSRCPDECRQTISSLVYAAARVSEVPELRDLRSLFAERYGNSLDQFVDPEFVERFKAEPPSKEMKMELLQQTAREYSIKWDAKSLEQRLYTPPHHTETEQPITKSNDPKTTMENRSSQGRNVYLDDTDKSMSVSSMSMSRSRSRSEGDSTSTSGSCVNEPEGDVENKPFYYKIMDAAFSKAKIEKQESLPEKMMKSHLITEDNDSPTADKPKPRSVRQRFANPPSGEVEALKQSKNTRSDSMAKASGEGVRRMSRRTTSWQANHSTVPDFDYRRSRRCSHTTLISPFCDSSCFFFLSNNKKR